jgi:hypothetical protein
LFKIILSPQNGSQGFTPGQVIQIGDGQAIILQNADQTGGQQREYFGFYYI